MTAWVQESNLKGPKGDKGDPGGSADLSTVVLKAGDTMTGKLTTKAGDASGAPLNIPIGVATGPVDGDIWYQTNTLALRVGGSTVTFINSASTQTIGGVKTFTTSPVLPTPAAADNSTKGATTAYVDAAASLDVKKAGDTMSGKLFLPVSTVASAPLNIPLGVTPSAPIEGDLWSSVSGVLTYRSATVSATILNSQSTQTISGVKTFTAKPIMTTPTAGTGSINLPHGVAPTAPVDGDMWTTTAGLFIRINGVTKQVTLT